MVAPILSDYMYQFGDNGVTHGTDTYDLLEVTGLDMPEIRVVENDRDSADGSFVFAPYLRSRSLMVTGAVRIATGTSTTQSILDDLKKTYAPTIDPQPFYFKHPGSVQRLAYCNSLGVRYRIAADEWNIGYVNFQALLIAGDPRIYSSDAIVSGPNGQPSSPATGFIFPISFPLTFGSPVQGGAVTVTNAGNKETWPVITINGPITNPIITNATTSRAMKIRFTFGVTDSIVIDMGARTAQLNGTDRVDLVDSVIDDWIFLASGDNTFLFASDVAALGTFTIAFRSAWF